MERCVEFVREWEEMGPECGNVFCKIMLKMLLDFAGIVSVRSADIYPVYRKILLFIQPGKERILGISSVVVLKFKRLVKAV